MIRVALCLLLACTMAVVAGATTIPFKVVTFNIANYNDHGNWDVRVKLIADALANADADVVALQETRFDPDQASTKQSYQNMAEQILMSMNQRGSYAGASLDSQPTMFYPVGGPQYPLPAAQGSPSIWEGSSMMAKRKIVETGTRFLTKTTLCTDANLRATQYAMVDLSSARASTSTLHKLHPNRTRTASTNSSLALPQQFYLFNTHFGLAGECLTNNARETVQYMQKLCADSPCLLVGDLNATPDNPALQELVKGGLVDLWAKLYPSLPGYTFPSTGAIKRIDFGWANAVLMKNGNLKKVSIIGTQPANGIFASDHFGLLFEFDLTI